MNYMESQKTRCEIFTENAKQDIDKYRKELIGDGSFDFSSQIKELEKLQSNMSQSTLVYLFGDDLGRHLFAKFVNEYSRNLLSFFRGLHSEYRFFILYELKNNKYLFSY